jgi:hypothetical protein
MCFGGQADHEGLLGSRRAARGAGRDHGCDLSTGATTLTTVTCCGVLVVVTSVDAVGVEPL